jgi:hypothetical protein
MTDQTQSYTPTTFCAAEHISRAFLYKLRGQGNGPRFYMVGNRRRISEEARQEWRRQLEAKTGNGGAK